MNKCSFSPQWECRGIFAEVMNHTLHLLESKSTSAEDLLVKLKENAKLLPQPQTVSSFRLPMIPSAGNTTEITAWDHVGT